MFATRFMHTKSQQRAGQNPTKPMDDFTCEAGHGTSAPTKHRKETMLKAKAVLRKLVIKPAPGQDTATVVTNFVKKQNANQWTPEDTLETST